MNSHASFQHMLARRDRLTADEEIRLALHLEQCSDCRERASAWDHQITFLRSFRRENPPSELRAHVLAAVDRREGERGETRRPVAANGFIVAAFRRIGRLNVRSPWSALAAVSVAVGAVVLAPLVSQRAATPVSAYQLLRSSAQTMPSTPYHSTATVHFQAPESAMLSGHLVQHALAVTLSANNVHHFRMDVQTVRPALDGGTLTIVANGSRLTEYDTRTNTASVTTGDGASSLSSLYGRVLGLQGSLSDGLPPIAPDRSIQRYLASLQSGTIPTDTHHYAREIGQQRVLGRTADVVKFAPLVTGCVRHGDDAPGGCGTPKWSGTGTVWIDHDTHLILKYQASLPDRQPEIENYVYQVTSLTLDTGVSPQELTYQPPVNTVSGSLSAREVSGRPAVRAGLFAAPAPAGIAGAPTSLRDVQQVTTPPSGQVTAVNALYLQRRLSSRLDTIPNPGEPAHGHYLYIEQRVQVHGLPAALRRGIPVAAGACRAWTGSNTDGQHWLAFAEGSKSVLVMSDSLPERDLVRYVAEGLCREKR